MNDVQQVLEYAHDAISIIGDLEMPDRQLLDSIIVSKAADVGLEELQTSGALSRVFPEVTAMVGFGGAGTGHKDLWSHTKRVVIQTVPVAALRWSALFHDVGKVHTVRVSGAKVSFHGHEVLSARLFEKAAKRTRLFEAKEQERISFVIRNLGLVESYLPEWSDSAVRRLYRDTKGYFDDLVALARADITTGHIEKRQKHHRRLQELVQRAQSLAEQDAIPPALPKGLGEALMQEFGLKPSKALGDLRKQLEAAVEAGELPRQAGFQVYIDFAKSRKLA